MQGDTSTCVEGRQLLVMRVSAKHSSGQMAHADGYLCIAIKAWRGLRSVLVCEVAIPSHSYNIWDLHDKALYPYANESTLLLMLQQ